VLIDVIFKLNSSAEWLENSSDIFLNILIVVEIYLPGLRHITIVATISLAQDNATIEI
jgi:hypothetical protein